MLRTILVSEEKPLQEDNQGEHRQKVRCTLIVLLWKMSEPQQGSPMCQRLWQANGTKKSWVLTSISENTAGGECCHVLKLPNEVILKFNQTEYKEPALLTEQAYQRILIDPQCLTPFLWFFPFCMLHMKIIP